MTKAEIDNICDLMRAAGRTTVPVSLTEWREYQYAKCATKDQKQVRHSRGDDRQEEAGGYDKADAGK